MKRNESSESFGQLIEVRKHGSAAIANWPLKWATIHAMQASTEPRTPSLINLYRMVVQKNNDQVISQKKPAIYYPLLASA